MRESGGNSASSVQIGSGGVNALTIDSNQDITLTGASANIVFDKSDNALEFADDAKAKFGNSADFNIYHTTTGNSSYILNSTGNLNIGSNNEVRIKGGDDAAEHMGRFIDNGAVELYFDASKKIETHANGVNIFGRLLIGDSSGVNDNRIRLGADGDLHLYHDGSNSYIKEVNAVAGQLIIDGYNGTDIRHGATGENMIRAFGGGAVEIYHNNSKKIETESNGASITGVLNLSDNLDMPDNAKVVLGTGDDLKIYSDGSTVFYAGDDQRFRNKALDENFLTFAANGAATLFFDGSPRLTTSTLGVTVTGGAYPAAADTYQLGGGSLRWNELNIKSAIDISDDGVIRMGDNDEFTIKYVGSTNQTILKEIGGGSFLLQCGSFFVQKQDGSENMIRATPDGAVDLYHNNVIKFSTDADGAEIFGNRLRFADDVKAAFGSGGDMTIFHGGDTNTIDSGGKNFQILHSSDSSLQLLANSSANLYFDGALKLTTVATGVKVTELQIAPSGINTTPLMTFGGGGLTTNADSYTHFYDRATAGSNTTALLFRTGASAAHVGSVNFNNTTTFYNTSSDYRLKENAVNISDGITRLKTLKPYRFNFKGESTTVDGFFAHEITAVPEAVTGTKDEVDSQGNPILQAIDQSKLVPLLVAAVQELIGRVEKLEAA